MMNDEEAELAQLITNTAPNQGAQGTFNGPVYFQGLQPLHPGHTSSDHPRTPTHIDLAQALQIRQEALVAVHTKDWQRAALLLSQLVQVYPDDQEVQKLFTRVQQCLDCQERYHAVVMLFDAEQWNEAYEALVELDKRCPQWPDVEDQRDLLEEHLQRERLIKKGNDALERGDLAVARSTVWQLRQRDPDDRDALSLLRCVQVAQEQAEQERQRRLDQAQIQVEAGNFRKSLDLIETIVTTDSLRTHQATILATSLIEQSDVPLDLRLRAGRIVSTIGDHRLPVTLEEWVSSLQDAHRRFGQQEGYWCYVRPGTYLIGGWHTDQVAAHITLPGFWIARYPITIAQFMPFADCAYKGRNARWWSEAGRWSLYTESLGQQELRLGQKNRPVEHANWYDATGFAAWLNDQLSEEVLEPYVVRLPTEAEWEAAAAFNMPGERHIYPWGALGLDYERAAYDYLYDEPVTVGSFPAGQAPCGALDLIGNVWECTASSWHDYPQNSHTTEPSALTDTKAVWRGGSYRYSSDQQHCGSRSNFAGHEFPVGGLRLVIAQRLP